MARRSNTSFGKIEEWESRNLDEHMRLISMMVQRSLKDAETRQLAVKLVSGVVQWREDPRTGREVPVVQAWGHYFRAPEGAVCKARDDLCEIERIWETVALNLRYVYDPEDADYFATVRRTFEAGGGDCDDMVIVFGSLLKAIGFKVVARVIATKKNPNEWVHTYPLVGVSKDNPRKWIPLDATVNGALPGWEYKDIAAHRDFVL